MDQELELTYLAGAQPPAALASSASLASAVWLKIAIAQPLLNTAAQRFWSHPDLPRFFPLFLFELYSLVSCSVPLMTTACERAEALASTDLLAARTAGYLKRHIEEELHHDEWLLDDLVAAGMDRDEVLRRTPSENVALLVDAQYGWIRQAHPAALFGYLGVIEGNPPLAAHIEEIRVQTGYPAETFRCMHLHAGEDVEHLRELKETITSLPLTESSAALISMSAIATVEGVIRILEGLVTN
ncbi:MAG: iron-containing redox enzyme family protein [Candidatus Korobacteraceae bacterium]